MCRTEVLPSWLFGQELGLMFGNTNCSPRLPAEEPREGISIRHIAGDPSPKRGLRMTVVKTLGIEVCVLAQQRAFVIRLLKSRPCPSLEFCQQRC